MNTSRWLIIILVVILVLAGIQWKLNTSPDAYFNRYGEATSTPITATSTNSVATTTSQGAPIIKTQPTKNLMHTVTIETNKGTIVFETYDADAPKTVQNFITLAQKGFYDKIIFHRVIKNFMIQGGDPTGTGMGGPGYKFEDELNPQTASYKAGYVRGTVAMANSGPNTNGSQFFIMHKDTPLPHSYTIFGRVVSGMEIVDKIAAVSTDANKKPLTPVTMVKVTEIAK